jgi:hypothetical protein
MDIWGAIWIGTDDLELVVVGRDRIWIPTPFEDSMIVRDRDDGPCGSLGSGPSREKLDSFNFG